MDVEFRTRKLQKQHEDHQESEKAYEAQTARRYQAAFRYGKAGQRSPEAVATWLRLGERRAQRLYCAPFDERRLRASLDELRIMTLHFPEDFQKYLQAKLADCGVTLVVCPHFPKPRRTAPPSGWDTTRQCL